MRSSSLCISQVVGNQQRAQSRVGFFNNKKNTRCSEQRQPFQMEFTDECRTALCLRSSNHNMVDASEKIFKRVNVGFGMRDFPLDLYAGFPYGFIAKSSNVNSLQRISSRRVTACLQFNRPRADRKVLELLQCSSSALLRRSVRILTLSYTLCNSSSSGYSFRPYGDHPLSKKSAKK